MSRYWFAPARPVGARPAMERRAGPTAPRPAWIALGLLAAIALGCERPTVRIEHRLPADLDVPAGAGQVRPGAITAEGPAADHVELIKREIGASGGVLRGAGETLTVDADVTVQANHDRGERVIRVGNPAGGLEARTVKTLRRRLSAKAVFVVRDEGGDTIGVVEADESYDSADDPRTRGELGLRRPDAPENLPPVETITEELIVACVETLRRMVKPAVVTAAVELQPVGGADVRAWVEAGQYARALEQIEQALRQRPDHAGLLFNAAVLSEATGDLTTAEQRYKTAAEQAELPAAEKGLQRVRRVRSHLEVAQRDAPAR